MQYTDTITENIKKRKALLCQSEFIAYNSDVSITFAVFIPLVLTLANHITPCMMTL